MGDTPDYTRAIERLHSFYKQEWPSTSMIAIEDMVYAGFYFTGEQDKVACPWCLGKVMKWEKGDDPLAEHRKHFPRCKFVKERITELVKTGVQDVYFYDGDVMNTRVVRAIRAMGYPEDVIKGAVTLLFGTCDIKPSQCVLLNTTNLLDAIFELESSMGFTVELEENPDQNIPPAAPQPDNTILNLFREELVSSQAEVKRLEEELTALKNDRRCKVCMDETISTLFVPCNHFVCCDRCAFRVRQCPVCRQRIRSQVKPFMN